MPEEFEGDLTEAVFWGALLRRASFRDIDFTGARISHAWVVDVEIDAFVEGLVVNGVDVTAYVDEHDPWYPLRTVLRPTGPESMRAGWARLQDAWAERLERAGRLPAEAARRSVAGEWSLVQTLRHLLFAMDKWFTLPIAGGALTPFGLTNTGSIDFPWPGLDRGADPPLAEVLAARAEQAARFAAYLATVTDDDLSGTVDVLENGPHQVRDCIATVLEEEFWHLRYADRDLDVVEQDA